VGSDDKSKVNYDDIPQTYRGMCKMVTFKSVGWRNVSVGGFLGLLVLAAAITLAGVKTENGELWLNLGAALLFSPIKLCGQIYRTIRRDGSLYGVFET